MTIILSNHFVRYTLMPWSPDLITKNEKVTFARICFEKVYGSMVSTWDIRVADYDYGKPTLASAVDKELVDLIFKLVNKDNFKLISLQPLLVESSYKNIKQSNKNFLLYIAEPGCITLLNYKDDEMNKVKTVYVGMDLSTELMQLFEREKLPVMILM